MNKYFKITALIICVFNICIILFSDSFRITKINHTFRFYCGNLFICEILRKKHEVKENILLTNSGNKESILTPKHKLTSLKKFLKNKVFN